MSYNNMNINEIFEKLFMDFDDVFTTPVIQKGGEIYHAPNFPPVNIYINEESKDLTFEFAVAGYEKEDALIEFNGDKMKLTIKGKQEGIEGLRVLKKGIKTPDINSAFTVPVSKYETDNSKAEMKDGILIVKVPAKDEIKPKRLAIN